MAYRHRRCILAVGMEGESSAVLDAVAVRHAAVVRRFASERDCLRQLHRRACELLVIDLEGTVRERLELLAQAREVWPWQSSLVLVAKGGISDAVEAMRTGATDCLEKPVQEDRLLAAIERGLDRTASLFASETSLTPMDAAILKLLLTGNTSREIAGRLRRSSRTIDTHRQKIYCKLGVSDFSGIVPWAVRAGVLMVDRQAAHRGPSRPGRYADSSG